MARLFDDASSQHVTVATAPLTAYPWSLSLWFYADAVSINQCMWSLADTAGTAERWEVLVTSGNVVRFGSRASSVTVNADGGGTVSVNTWYHVCARAASATDRKVDWTGGAQGTNVTSNTPASIDAMSFGRRHGSVPGAYWSGRLAAGTLWNVALSDGEVTALQRGVAPRRIRPGSLAGDWPIWGTHDPEIDLTPNGRSLTVTGATGASHAPVAPFHRIWTPASGGVAVAAASRLMLPLPVVRGWDYPPH